MIAGSETQVQLLIEEGRRLEAAGDRRSAGTIYRKALDLDPSNSRALNRAGELAYRSGQWDTALGFIQRAIANDPRRWRSHKTLGNVFRWMYRFEAAERSFENTLALNPDAAEAHYDLGILYQTWGHAQKALASYRRCLQLEPNYPHAYNNAGLIHAEQNETQAALACFTKAIEKDRNFAGAHLNLGLLHKKARDYRQALRCFQNAARCEPGMAEAHRCMGEVLATVGELTAAIRCYIRATQLLPDSAVLWVNLGTAYHGMHTLHQAMECYEKALSIDAMVHQAWLNKGLVHRDWHQYAEAADCFQQALDIDPDYAKALVQLVSLRIHLCDWGALPGLAAQLDDLTCRALRVGRKPDETPFLNIMRIPDPALNLKVAAAWSAEAKIETAGWKAGIHHHSCRTKKNKLRLGYLSGNFQSHPTAELILGLLTGHDRERFDVYTYSYGQDDGGRMRKKIVAASDRFHDIRGSNDRQAAERIAGDEVDILIDLMGHTQGARMPIGAQRPAPVQVRYLGMAGTTGGDFFDYIVVDPIICPFDHAPFYSEKPIYMPFCYQVNDYAARWPDDTLEASLSVEPDPFIFCCFSTAYKIDPVVFRLWMKILRQVPNSILWLLPGNRIVERNLAGAAQSEGVNPDRLIFQEKLPIERHLQRLKGAHLALDTLTVSGAATTSDALWAGVPVITQRGRHFASKMSESIIRAAGLSELVARDREQYEKLAIHLASAPAERRRIRNKLVRQRNVSPLFHTAAFISAFESGMEMIWERFAAGRPPVAIEIGGRHAF